MFVVIIICLSILLICSILLFSLCPLIKKKNLKKNFFKIYGKKIYKLAYKDDYYLLNNVKLKANDDTYLYIDHILFGNKYFYIIKDYYFNGGLSIKDIDPSWVFYYGNFKKPKQKYIDNLMNENKKRIDRFCQLTGLESSLFISIVLINDDCTIVDYVNNNDNNFVSSSKQLKQLIKNIENRNVAPLNPVNLNYAVRDINKLNVNKKHEKGYKK